MREFLTKEAEKMFPEIFKKIEFVGAVHSNVVEYNEDINEDAINGDEWLKNNTSYIYKVATLAVIDWNKCDHVRVFVGINRDGEGYNNDFIGCLYFGDGENDDIGRVLDRILECLRLGHPVFEAN